MTPGIPTVHARGVGAVMGCSAGRIPGADDLRALHCRPARPAGVWEVPWDRHVWLVPMPDSYEMLICTSVSGGDGITLCNDAADYVFNGAPHSRKGPLRYASCLRLPVRPLEPLQLPSEGTRCRLVHPPGRWWPVSISFVPVAFSLVVTRHKDWATAQYFIEAHIGHNYLSRDGDGRRDLYGTDLRHLQPLIHDPTTLESFTGAVVTTMVRCARPGRFLQKGATLGVADGVFVRDQLGQGCEVDGEIVFDMKLPNSSKRIVTTHHSPCFIPVVGADQLTVPQIRCLVREDRKRCILHHSTG